MRSPSLFLGLFSPVRFNLPFHRETPAPGCLPKFQNERETEMEVGEVIRPVRDNTTREKVSPRTGAARQARNK